jgi:hypothetical protein
VSYRALLALGSFQKYFLIGTFQSQVLSHHEILKIFLSRLIALDEIEAGFITSETVSAMVQESYSK